MKINTIIHENSKSKKNDASKNKLNKNQPQPFLKEREFMRALNATKIDRLLAKPFVSAYAYHLEGISQLCNNKQNDLFASASFDSSVYVWDINGNEKYLMNFNEKINGLSFLKNNLLIAKKSSVVLFDGPFNSTSKVLCKEEFETDFLNGIISLNEDFLVCATNGIKIYDLNRKTPKISFGTSFSSCAAVNPLMDHIVAFSEAKKLNLVDLRANNIFSSLDLGIKTNSVQFSYDGRYFASGNEDSVLYVHDLRYLTNTFAVFRQHLNSINSVDFGKKIVSGSADKTIRIFDLEAKKCLDVYHSRRMQSVTGVRFNKTEEFIVSGSIDGSLRVWKTCASKKIGPITNHETQSLKYKSVLKEKFKDVNEIQRISKQRFLPRELKSKIKQGYEMAEAQKRRKEKRNKANEEK